MFGYKTTLYSIFYFKNNTGSLSDKRLHVKPFCLNVLRSAEKKNQHYKLFFKLFAVSFSTAAPY